VDKLVCALAYHSTLFTTAISLWWTGDLHWLVIFQGSAARDQSYEMREYTFATVSRVVSRA
jgi:hypothetical protein